VHVPVRPTWLRVARCASGGVYYLEAAMTDYDCRTIEDRLAALEARLAQTDDALTGQYAGLSRRVDWLRSDVQDMRLRLDALWLALDGPEDRLKEVSDGSSNNS